ncbi:MAG: hypothetical protein QOG20_1899 [Pseudonocardiales bacterium]|nr:hypothetical protein [Pseudonocardiales bacterium]
MTGLPTRSSRSRADSGAAIRPGVCRVGWVSAPALASDRHPQPARAVCRTCRPPVSAISLGWSIQAYPTSIRRNRLNSCAGSPRQSNPGLPSMRPVGVVQSSSAPEGRIPVISVRTAFATSRSLVLVCWERRRRRSNASSALMCACVMSAPIAWSMVLRERSAVARLRAVSSDSASRGQCHRAGGLVGEPSGAVLVGAADRADLAGVEVQCSDRAPGDQQRDRQRRRRALDTAAAAELRPSGVGGDVVDGHDGAGP